MRLFFYGDWLQWGYLPKSPVTSPTGNGEEPVAKIMVRGT